MNTEIVPPPEPEVYVRPKELTQERLSPAAEVPQLGLPYPGPSRHDSLRHPRDARDGSGVGNK